METTNNNQEATSSKVYKTTKAQREANKRYREKNKEKRDFYSKEYRAQNRDLLNERSKAFYHKKGYQKQYYSKEKRQEYYKEYYQENKAKLIEGAKKWAKNNKEKVSEIRKKATKKWHDKQLHFYKFIKDTGLTYKVEILKMNRVEAKTYAELNKYEYVKC